MPGKVSVKMFSPPEATPTISPIPATVSHFGTAGRLLAWFPTVNKNGFTVLSEDVPDSLIATLVGSTVDLEHVKRGYGQVSMLVPKENNTIVGSIVSAVRTPAGIDIADKLERSVVQSFGFTTADFEPGSGILAQYSQEMDFTPQDGKFIVVDKDDPKKIIKTLSYADGLAAGLPDTSKGVGPSKCVSGTWEYSLYEGNPVYFAVIPLSFCGAGHVAKPADPSALTYKMVANEKGEQKILGFYPGMDDGPSAPSDMTGIGLSDDMHTGNDLNVWAGDFLSNPDVLTASADKFNHDAEAADPKNKDDSFAVNYSNRDFSSVTNGKPNISRTRRFLVKNDKGELDRPRLISAYRGLMGMRGDTHTHSTLPLAVKQHAMALVRQGLHSTKPKITKETASAHMEDLTIEQLDAKIAEMAAAKKLFSADVYQAAVDRAVAAEAAVVAKDGIVAAKDTEIATLTASLAEANTTIDAHKATALSAERLIALEAVHPFTTEEKTEEFIKGLASLSTDGMEIKMLQRENAKLKAAPAAGETTRLLASTASTRPGINPVPSTGTGITTTDPIRIGVGDLY